MFNSAQREVLSKHCSTEPFSASILRYSRRATCGTCLLSKNLTNHEIIQVLQVTHAATLRLNVLQCMTYQQEFNEAFWITESQCHLQPQWWILHHNTYTWPKLYPETILHHQRLASMAASSMFFARLTSTKEPQRNPASCVGPATERYVNLLMGTGRYDSTCLQRPCPVNIMILVFCQSYILRYGGVLQAILKLGWVCLKQASNKLPNKSDEKKHSWKQSFNFRISTSTSGLQHLWALFLMEDVFTYPWPW